MSAPEIEMVQEPKLPCIGQCPLQAEREEMMKCGYPSCADPEDEHLVVRPCIRPSPSLFARLKYLLLFLIDLWKTYRGDEYYRSLARGTLFFVFGLKLFRDVAIHMTEDSVVPKC